MSKYRYWLPMVADVRHQSTGIGYLWMLMLDIKVQILLTYWLLGAFCNTFDLHLAIIGLEVAA